MNHGTSRPPTPAASVPPASSRPVDHDAEQLGELGYEQELKRSLGVLGNLAIGFATVSPVVGLYAVAQVGTTIAGPAWVWVLPICLLGQALLMCVYSELASQYPIAGGAYQWARRLVGPTYAWLAGWVGMCAVVFANTTIVYLGAPWFFALFDAEPTPGRIVVVAAIFLMCCTAINAFGIDVLRWVLAAGIAAEALASLGVGLALLLVFRENGFGILTDTMGAEALSGGSTFSALPAALAVGGWAFFGFDACVSSSEETKDAARQVPKAIWWTLISVGGLVVLNAVAAELAHPDPARVVAGEDLDPVTTAVVNSFGSWSAKPFVVVVIIAFIACALASQAAAARSVYSVSRDGVLPGSRALRVVSQRQAPVGALVITAAISCLALLPALNSAAIGSLITFGSAAMYLQFLLIALAALIARLRGTWTPGGLVRFGRWGTPLNVLAVAWLAFEFVNIAWPRKILAPPGAPAYQVWAAVLGIVVVVATGVLYLLFARPQDKVRVSESFGDRGADTPTSVPQGSNA
ncbi:APC family permease [Embleya sp. NPDC005971]|uniref:APC family permease n=1 Tax=Embleya sp. NPDC005971 TaxID=3156724 RepID=UPI003401F9D9